MRKGRLGFLVGHHEAYLGPLSDMEFVKNFTPSDFQEKILHRQFHLILTVLVRKNTKNEWKWRNLHRWQKFYTAAGTDGTDKFHLWRRCPGFLLLVRSWAGENGLTKLMKVFKTISTFKDHVKSWKVQNKRSCYIQRTSQQHMTH